MSDILTIDVINSTKRALADAQVQSVPYPADVRFIIRTLDRAECYLAAGNHLDANSVYRIALMCISTLM